jgi:hypothetical protein
VDEDLFYEMATKLIGVIFRKALLENNMEKVYGRVFKEIASKTFENDIHILEIFGDVGG